jgi:DNA-binding HxlR family transcriptional regulator
MADDPLVRRSPVRSGDCNLARSFELIGDRWTLLVLRSALYGIRRFADFQADHDVPRSVLSKRLAALVENGLMELRDYRDEGQRVRSEYLLTEMGRTLALPFMAVTDWGDRWLGKGPFTLKSRKSGKSIRVAYVDEQDRVVAPADVTFEISKAKPASRRKATRR